MLALKLSDSVVLKRRGRKQGRNVDFQKRANA